MPHFLHMDDLGTSHMNTIPDRLDWLDDPFVAEAKEKEKEKPKPDPVLDIEAWSWGDANGGRDPVDDFDGFSWGPDPSTTDDFALIF